MFIICSLLESCLQLEVKKIPLDKLGLQHNYNDIVRDLIKNWDSPIVYLRQLGYLPNDFEDTSRIKPNLDELLSRMEGDGQKESLRREHVDTDKFVKRLHKRHNVVKHNCCQRQERTKLTTEQRGQRQALPVGQDKSKLLDTKVQGARHISDAKVDEIKKELDQQQVQKEEPMNVAMLGRALAKQKAELVQPQPQPQPVVANPPVDESITDSMDPSDKYLMELVAKTSPKQEEQAQQVAPAAEVTQVAVAPPLAIAPANSPAVSQGFAPATSAMISPAISPAIAPGIAAAKTNPKSLVKAPRVAAHLVDSAAKESRITMPLEPISFDSIGAAEALDDDKSQSMYVLQELKIAC